MVSVSQSVQRFSAPFNSQGWPLVILVAFWLLMPFAEGSERTAGEAPTCAITQQALTQSWSAYKATYIQGDGRVRDPKAENISTSESQAYAMLRAVWMRDPDTFASVYRWAIDNLRTPKAAHHAQPNVIPNASQEKSLTPNATSQSPLGGLFAWKWGKKEDGSWGVLEMASASDADEDIALALLMAHEAWPNNNNAFYDSEAKKLLAAIWEQEVVTVKGLGPVFLAGDWDKTSTNAYWQLNPSYFSPVAYKVFAQADPSHPWGKLVDSSYTLLDSVVTQTRTGLPPNWFRLSKTTKGPLKSRLQLYTGPKDMLSDYGYDAIRIHWRVGLDYLLNPNEKRAEALLHHTNFIERYWAIREKLPSPLTIDGIERNLDEILYPSNAIYGATLIHLMLSYPAIATAVAQHHILGPLKDGLWQPMDDYYAQNWLWLGLLAYQTQICAPPSKPLARPATTKEALVSRLSSLYAATP